MVPAKKDDDAGEGCTIGMTVRPALIIKRLDARDAIHSLLLAAKAQVVVLLEMKWRANMPKDCHRLMVHINKLLIRR